MLFWTIQGKRIARQFADTNMQAVALTKHDNIYLLFTFILYLHFIYFLKLYIL